MDYASNGKANLAVTLGGIGAGLGVLNAHSGLLGGLLGGGAQAVCPENQPVNRYEMGLIQESAAKDNEIALLKADKYTDQKMIEVYTNLEGQINTLAAEVRKNKEDQCQVNMNQAVLNGTVGCAISGIQGVIAQITKTSVPNEAVCPGFGNVQVVPVQAQTGTTVA